RNGLVRNSCGWRPVQTLTSASAKWAASQKLWERREVTPASRLTLLRPTTAGRTFQLELERDVTGAPILKSAKDATTGALFARFLRFVERTKASRSSGCSKKRGISPGLARKRSISSLKTSPSTVLIFIANSRFRSCFVN